MGATTRGFPWADLTDPADAQASFQELANFLNSDGMKYKAGTLAARPAAAAANAGTLYWAVDNARIYYSDGAAWTDVTTAAITAHTAAADPHPVYALDTDLATHAGAADPHPAYATDVDLGTHAALPAVHHDPANDPTANQKAALAGTSGAPAVGNKFVTDADPRNTDARAPTNHDATKHTTTALVEISIPFGKQGALAVQTGALRWLADKAYTIVDVRVSVNTAPTGASILVDVNKNGVTLFTNQAHRPSIVAGAFAGQYAIAIDVSALAAGDYLTVDIDQVGSTIAGADLTVVVVMRRA